MTDGPKLENLNLKPAPEGRRVPYVGNLPKVTPSEHWRPIETAPKDGATILLTGGQIDPMHSSEGPPLVAARYEDEWWQGEWVITHYDGGCAAVTYFNATHWMPSPETP